MFTNHELAPPQENALPDKPYVENIRSYPLDVKELSRDEIGRLSRGFYEEAPEETAYAAWWSVQLLRQRKDLGFTWTTKVVELGHDQQKITVIDKIDWETREEDFAAMRQWHQWLLDNPDQILQGKKPDEMAKMWHDNFYGAVHEDRPVFPLMDALTSDEIERSPAHEQNPGEHSQSVTNLIDTSKLTEEYQRRRIWLMAPVHDLMKVLIANGDYLQLHADLSAKVFKQYLTDCYEQEDSRHLVEALFPEGEEITSDKLESLASVIKMHHMSELLQFKVLTVTDAALLLDLDVDLFELVTVLSKADTSSVNKYAAFAALPDLNELLLKAKAKLIDAEQFNQQLPELIDAQRQFLQSFIVKNIQQLEAVIDIITKIISDIRRMIQVITSELDGDVVTEPSKAEELFNPVLHLLLGESQDELATT